MKKVLKGLRWFLDSYIWLFLLMLALDIITKNIICHTLNVGDSIPLIPNFLHITYTINTKAAFSIGFPDNLNWLNKLIYSIVAVGATIAITFYYVKKQKTMSSYIKACLMLIVAGALGNLIDRIFYTPEYLNYSVGGVVDFIDFCGIWNAIFNIADCCIVIAAFMLLIYFIIDMVKDYMKENKKNDSEKPQLSKTEIELQKQKENKEN